ncbi:hypothetical protein B0H66DRAFT_551574 [Apodospora peruviana]|uniref:Uncharacterized protein n=1 Tax=Apodospora peruviana TaxID=516989 RepID=A0AAE0IKD2_9PEZI|nr:hypothetical protein B0H66DRAFT_551574 [Apodospora peruviana]
MSSSPRLLPSSVDHDALERDNLVLPPQRSPFPFLGVSKQQVKSDTTAVVVEASESHTSLLGQHQQGRGRLSRYKMWRGHGSIYLRREFLVGLALLFLSFLATEEVLNHLSDRYRGFAFATEDKHYLWTYGPTFFLSIIAALWGQLEYQVQHSIPWMELARAPPLPADSNLLVNYLTPWSIVSLFRSLRAGHFPVALSVTGGLVLKALIVVSTGLFALQDRQLSYPTQVRMLEQFNMSRGAYNDTTALPASTPDPGVLFWAINYGHVAPPAGVNSQYATTSFALDSSLTDLAQGPNSTISATVPVFAVDQDCTPFSWKYETKGKTTTVSEDQDTLFSLADIMSKDDFNLLSKYYVLTAGPRSYDPDPSLTNEFSSRFLNSTVIVDVDYDLLGGQPTPDDDTAAMFTSVVVDLPDKVSTVSAILCRFKYSVTKRPVTVSGDGSLIEVSSDIVEKLDLVVAPSEITRDVFVNMVSFEQNFLGTTDLGRLRDQRWLSLMNITTPQARWEAFADTALLSSSFQETYRRIAALVVKTIKIAPVTNDEIVPASAITQASRLVVTPVALRVMDALLAVMAVICMILCFYNFAPARELRGSLMDAAVVLASTNKDSPRLTQLLSERQEGGVPTMDGLKASLSGYLFSSTRNPSTAILVQDGGLQFDELATFEERKPATRLNGMNSQKPDHSTFWLPNPATTPFRISIIAITLIIFILLEVLFQLSKRNNGLADVATDNYARYTWIWLPTLLMSLVGLAYVAMDKAARTLHPFLELSRLNGSTVDALHFNPQSSVAVVAFIRALVRRHFGLCAIILTSILSVALAVSSSGLYSTTSVPNITNFSAAITSWFDIGNFTGIENGYYSVGKGPADVLFNQAIQFYNLSYPPGTYKGYAFATPDTTPTQNAAKVTFSNLPAARGQLNCSLHEYRPLDKNTFSHKQMSYDIAPPKWPRRCRSGRFGGSAPTNLTLSSAGGDPPGMQGPFGFLASTYWALQDDSTFALDNRLPGDVCHDERQHLFFVYGQRVGNDSSGVVVLHCVPYLESLEVEATFVMPEMRVNESPGGNGKGEVREVEGSQKQLWQESDTTKNKSIPLPMFGFITGPTFLGEENNFDGHFSALLVGKMADSLATFFPPSGGKERVTTSEMMGKDNVNGMIAALNSLCQELWAQALHFDFRRPIVDDALQHDLSGDKEAPLPGQKQIDATAVVPKPLGRAMLIQNELPTRLLEGFLLCMALAAVVSFWLVGMGKRTRVLPLDPGSVAARMALLAGSELVDRLEKEDGHKYERWKERDLLEGRRFGLRWWDSGRGDETGVVREGDYKRYGIDIIPHTG